MKFITFVDYSAIGFVGIPSLIVRTIIASKEEMSLHLEGT